MIINPYRFGIGNDANTKVLLHFDGADASTTFADDNIGGSAHPWSATGNAQIDTAQSVFGGAALLCDGNGDYVSATSSTDWNFSGDYTVDFWVRFNSLGSAAFTTTSAICTNNDGTGSWSLCLKGTASFHWSLYLGASPAIEAASAPSAGTWYHVAIVRSGNTAYLYINGTSVGSVAESTTRANGVFKIGQDTWIGTGANRDLDGWIDEFRVSNVARWTANFTPSAAPYS